MSIDDHLSGNGSSALPRTERPDAPAYLTRHLARRSTTAPERGPADEGT